MKISQFNSRSERERERERESSLRTSSSLKFKKSFTLIELSIVLLILSLLVGSLLVGRQIVDRAKIQRIIFEFDYYEKAFHQFYDTYRVVPGALTKKKCNNYSQFTGYPNNRFTNFCDCIGISNEQWKIDNISLGCYGTLAYSTATQLAVSGLIDKEPPILSGQYNTNGVKYDYQKAGNFCPSGTSTSLVGHWTNNPANNIKSSFDESVWFQFTGFAFDRMIKSGVNMDTYKAYAFHGSNTYFNRKLPHEFDNAQFKKAIDLKNALEIIYYQTEAMRDHNNINASQAVINSLQINGYGALSAKMASELDSKIDDGRPGTGKVLAMKSGDAHRAETSEAQHIAGCYDKTADKVDKAIYHTTTNLKYGCNIIKVMEDVK